MTEEHTGDGAAANAAPDPDKTSKPDLVKAAKAAGIDPTGLTKDDLAEQIQTAKDTGRPPLSQVGEAAVAVDQANTRVVIHDETGDQIVAEPALADVPDNDPAVTGQED